MEGKRAKERERGKEGKGQGVERGTERKGALRGEPGQWPVTYGRDVEGERGKEGEMLVHLRLWGVMEERAGRPMLFTAGTRRELAVNNILPTNKP